MTKSSNQTQSNLTPPRQVGSLNEHLDNGPLGFIEWDEEFRVRSWSKRSEQIFGWSADEVVGKRPDEWHFVADQDRLRVDELIRDLIEQRTFSNTSANRNYTKRGLIIDCVWYNSVRLKNDGSLDSVFSLINDQTEIHRLALDLAREREHLEMALDAGKMGVWEWDLKDDRLVLSSQAALIFGFQNQQFNGTASSLRERVPAKDQLLIKGMITQAISNRTSYRVQFCVIRGKSDVAWVEATGRVTFDERDSRLAIRAAGTLVDITERKAVEAELIKAKQSAEKANSFKSNFLANMSHEIRTPLGVILGFSELLAEAEETTHERKESIEAIRRNGLHLSRLIDDILDLSKVEAGRMEFRRHPTRLKDSLEDAIASLRLRAQERGLELKFNWDDRTPQLIETDEDRLRQIVVNLVGNALKFTEFGSVTVSVGVEQGGPGKTKPPSKLQIAIEDTGIGISEAGQAELFEPFSQADLSLTRQFGGTGLGLSLSRNLARSLGGDLVLDRSVAGKGSRFVVTIEMGDFAIECPIGAKHAKKPSAQPLQGLKILVAEDSFDTRTLMERVLSKRGAHVHFAFDGSDAISSAMDGDWDIVLMDIQMPMIDGYEATRLLRTAGFKKPIIALTAHAMKDERERSLAAGCNGHLGKPIEATSLVEKILETIE